MGNPVSPSTKKSSIGSGFVQVGDTRQHNANFCGRNFIKDLTSGSQPSSARLARKGLEKSSSNKIPVHSIFLPLDLGVKKAAATSTKRISVSGMAKKLRN